MRSPRSGSPLRSLSLPPLRTRLGEPGFRLIREWCTVPLMRPFLIDTDTASDDAVALVMALRALDVRVEAITVVSGNVPVRQATENALYTVELCGRADD